MSSKTVALPGRKDRSEGLGVKFGNRFKPRFQARPCASAECWRRFVDVPVSNPLNSQCIIVCPVSAALHCCFVWAHNDVVMGWPCSLTFRLGHRGPLRLRSPDQGEIPHLHGLWKVGEEGVSASFDNPTPEVVDSVHYCNVILLCDQHVSSLCSAYTSQSSVFTCGIAC